MPLRRHLLDLLELFALPALAVVLPWRVCFALYSRLAGCDWLYRGETRASLAGAQAMGRAAVPEDWMRQYRLMRLVDHADLFLTLFRGAGWMRRHLRLAGPGWPTTETPFLAITFHWGSGLWGLCHLREQGRDAAVLVRDIPPGAFRGRPVLGAYAWLRSRQTARSGGVETVPSSVNSLRELKKRLAAGQNLVALLDVPAEGKKNVCRPHFLGRTGVFPRGLVYFAASNRIPVVAYTTGIDAVTGARTLAVSEAMRSDDEDALAGFLVAHLERAIAEQPAHWHQWAGARAFFAGEED